MNCKESCVNGCILGDACPHIEYAQAAITFIKNTSLEDILKIADEKNAKADKKNVKADNGRFDNEFIK